MYELTVSMISNINDKETLDVVPKAIIFKYKNHFFTLGYSGSKHRIVPSKVNCGLALHISTFNVDNILFLNDDKVSETALFKGFLLNQVKVYGVVLTHLKTGEKVLNINSLRLKPEASFNVEVKLYDKYDKTVKIHKDFKFA